MISIVVSGRNDDYAGGFSERLFRTARYNSGLLRRVGVPHEWLLVEWNPVSGRPLLAERFVTDIPHARAVVVSPEVHARHVTNPHMPFDEMAAKNAGIRRARGDWTLVTNADILFGNDLVDRLRAGGFDDETLYRAHRVDVPADISDDDVETPGIELSSGEGRFPPCYYLGAGGDFCLAHTALWHRLRGFNQRVTFSTRAKDWQFFLSAAAQNVAVDFLGRVSHLDHVGGFRNTPTDELQSASVHFGSLWDIEFGLPVCNDDDWGFAELGQDGAAEHRIEHLSPTAGSFVSSDTPIDLQTWVGWPASTPDVFSASLLHAVCTASRLHRSLVVRVTEPSEAVALAGMAAVGAAFDVEVRSDWRWPEVPGLTLRPFVPAPSSPRGACLLLEKRAGTWEVYEQPSHRRFDVCPSRRPIADPIFNPMLGRRLLRACLRLQREGRQRVAIYGAGGHTRELLRWGIPDAISIQAILVSENAGGEIDGVPIASIDRFDPSLVDAVLLSSIPYEAEMTEAARHAGFERIVPLWSDWPPDFWHPASRLHTT